jgi:hypothetical protein
MRFGVESVNMGHELPRAWYFSILKILNLKISKILKKYDDVDNDL